MNQKLTDSEAELEKYEAQYQSFLTDTYTPQMEGITSAQTQLDQKKAELQQVKAVLDAKQQE